MNQPRHIIISDEEHQLPYSKGLMASSIMATGLAPARAFHVAEVIEQRLYDLHESSITRDELNVLALDDALTALAQFDQRKSQIVEMRFFGGLSIEETAEVLGVSPGTVMRDWTLAKAWLHREISRDERDES